MKKLNESILEKLHESNRYGSIIPSFKSDEGFYSLTNTEALDALVHIAEYFKDYVEFLKTDEGLSYIDAERDKASVLEQVSKSLSDCINKIDTIWEIER